MNAVIEENIDVANRFKDRQLDPATWAASLARAEVVSDFKEDLPAQMRAHLDAMIEQLPGRLKVFGEGIGALPEGLDLTIVSQSKIDDGAWNLTVEGRDHEYGNRSAEFRLQWSGEYAGGYHLFVLNSRGQSGVIPTIFDGSTVARELAIYTIGRQIHGTPLCRD